MMRDSSSKCAGDESIILRVMVSELTATSSCIMVLISESRFSCVRLFGLNRAVISRKEYVGESVRVVVRLVP